MTGNSLNMKFDGQQSQVITFSIWNKSIWLWISIIKAFLVQKLRSLSI